MKKCINIIWKRTMGVRTADEPSGPLLNFVLHEF